MALKNKEIDPVFETKSSEYIVPHDIPVYKLVTKVTELAEVAVVRSKSSSAEIVNYSVKHLDKIASLLNSLVIGRSKGPSIKTAEHLSREDANLGYIPVEVIEALVNSYTSQGFTERADEVLTTVYNKAESFFGLKVLAISDYELLKAAVLSIILPYQDQSNVVKLQKEINQLLFSGEVEKARIAKEERKVAGVQSRDEDSPQDSLSKVFENLVNRLRDLFNGN